MMHYAGFSIAVAAGWDDITDTVESVDPPLTIADPIHGVGALQLSTAIFQGGEHPRIGPSDLASLLDDFASQQGFGAGFDRLSAADSVIVEGASYRWGDDFVRVWYLSDGSNVILATYVCDWEYRDHEAAASEAAVMSIRFDQTSAA